MAKMIHGRADKIGLPPGAAVYVGLDDAHDTSIKVIDFDRDNYNCYDSVDPDKCRQFACDQTVSWIDVVGLGNIEAIKAVSEQFSLHPLVLEDILNTDQRPKLESYGDYIYVVVKMLQWDSESHKLISEQLSLVLADGFVLSFQQRPGDVFDPLRHRIEASHGRVRQSGADYLLYCLLDSVIDGYFVVLEGLGDQIEQLEDRSTHAGGASFIRQMRHLKRQVLLIRKNLWPLRELIASLHRSELEMIEEQTLPYLRDLSDHSVQVLDTLENFREMLSGVLDIHLSMESNRMNEVMKVLTIIATIFIPLTFVAGIYGMNFEYMPELHYRFAYFGVLGAMAVMAAAMVIYFRSKKWL